MKTTRASIKFIILLLLFGIAIAGCDSNDESVNPDDNQEIEEGEGLTEEDVENDPGAIGISISARGIARKGYDPSYADIIVNANTGDFSKTVSIDSLTNIAYLSYKNEDLTSEQKKELSDGVSVSVRILDENEALLSEEDLSKISFQPSPPHNEITAKELEDKYRVVNLRPDVKYYMQIVEGGKEEVYGVPSSQYYEVTNYIPSYVHLLTTDKIDYNSDFPDNFTTYFFEKISDDPLDIYAICVRKNGKKFYWHMRLDNKQLGIQNEENYKLNGGNTNPADIENYHFTIEKEENGFYTIKSIYYDKLLVIDPSKNTRLKVVDDNVDAQIAYFRILMFDIDWDIQTIGYKNLQPILPPSQTSFAYNSTLINCSSGELVQEVGVSESRESKSVSGWEESMAVSSSSEKSVSVTIGAEVETGFFGNNAKVNTSVTGSYSTTTSKTQTQTRSGSIENTETVVVSSQRTITVPPGKATLVSDMYQSYENVRIPFVQRFRVKGNYQEDGNNLSGEEILTQFSFNGFNGVVTEVGNDYIEVTVRGNNVIDRLIDTKTVAEDTPADCSN